MKLDFLGVIDAVNNELNQEGKFLVDCYGNSYWSYNGRPVPEDPEDVKLFK